jgi:hypothetical protein
MFAHQADDHCSLFETILGGRYVPKTMQVADNAADSVALAGGKRHTLP